MFCFPLSAVTTLTIMGRTKSPPYSFLQTGCTWPLSRTTGEYFSDNVISETFPWKGATPRHDVASAGLFASGSQEQKGWLCRRERTGSLTDYAATIIHKGESLPQGKYPPHWSLGATLENVQLHKMLSFYPDGSLCQHTPGTLTTHRSLQNQRRSRQVLEASCDSTQPAPPVPIHSAPLCLHTPDRAAAPPQEDHRVPHLQEHPGPPEDLLLLFGGRWLGPLNQHANNATMYF